MIALGVDLGGTKIAAGLVGGDGRVLASVRRPTPRGSAAAIVDAIAIVITDLLGETSGVDAIGIAVAGLVEARSGRVLHAVNLPLDQLALGTILEERLERRVSIVNDGNAAAVAEHFLGAARGTRYSITLTLGTGVGGGVIVDNALLGDRFGTGAELGHIVINAHGPLCQGGCPNHGCLEALASGAALIRCAKERGLDVEANDVLTLANSGDARAQAAVSEVGRALGIALATLANVFNPEVFVVGGGVALAAPPLLLHEAANELRQRALAGHRDARVAIAALGEHAPFVGAARLAATERQAQAVSV
jgi:glucokinase